MVPQLRLGELLVKEKVVDQADIDRAIERQRASGGSLGDNLLALGKVTADQLGALLHQAPQAPKSIAETGLNDTFLLSLMLKCMRVYGVETSTLIAREMRLIPAIIETLIETARQRGLIDSLGSGGSAVLSQLRWTLTDRGRAWAIDALELSQYVGPAPVPLATYSAQVQRQRISHERISPERLAKSFAQLILPPELTRELGPAANSGAALLLYGPPGNGKTSIAVALGAAFEEPIFVPHAIEVDGQVIKIFDPVFHVPVDSPADDPQPGGRVVLVRQIGNDARWMRCRRPVVVTGGELTLEMLDLSFDRGSKYYEAPLQVKAGGGIFVVDDFGRQLVSPQDILNRWVIPLERRVDYLTLHTGKKFPIPFDQLVIFSTNFAPGELMDAAMMRRVPYKIPVEPPSREDLSQIFVRVCKGQGIEPAEGLIDYLFDEHYSRENRTPARHHPKFIVDYAVAMCRYEGIKPYLDKHFVSEAFKHLYTTH